MRLRISRHPSKYMKAKQKAKKPEPLSNTPSIAILQALEDLKKIRKTPGYIIEMGDWHVSYPGKGCCVCFAGAVMAAREGVPQHKTTLPHDFPKYKRNMFRALNSFRQGDIMMGLDRLGVEWTDKMPVCIAVHEADDFPAFSRDMRKISRMLAKHGL